jgi:hypothetical protein
MKWFWKWAYKVVEKYRFKTTWPTPDLGYDIGLSLAKYLKNKAAEKK